MNTHFISTFVFFTFINIYAYNFFILNISLLYFTYLHFPMLFNGNSNNYEGNGKTESILFFSNSESLEYQQIDYTFDVGNYFVNIIIDNTAILYVFSINFDEQYQMKYLSTNKISSTYSNIYKINIPSIHFTFNPENGIINVLPDQECVISITVNSIN